MDLTTFLIQCLNSLQYGLLLFLVASGLTLIFGIMGVINLAHGSFYMVGAYLAFSLAPVVGATIGGGFFATLLVGRARFGWRGKRAVRVLYIGSGLLLLAYVGSRFVMEILLGRAT